MRSTGRPRRLFVLIACCTVGGLFLAAGILKLRSLPGFLVAIEGYQLIPSRMAVWLAVWVPWLEIFAGACVVTGIGRRAGGVVLMALLLAFSGAVLSAWARGLDIECGCFAAGGSSKVGPVAVARNLLLLALLASACFYGRLRNAPDSAPQAATGDGEGRRPAAR